jgi:hypothetical protein
MKGKSGQMLRIGRSPEFSEEPGRLEFPMPPNNCGRAKRLRDYAAGFILRRVEQDVWGIRRVCTTRASFFGRRFHFLSALGVLEAETVFAIAEPVTDVASVYSPEWNDPSPAPFRDRPGRDLKMSRHLRRCYRTLDGVDRRNQSVLVSVRKIDRLEWSITPMTVASL